VLNDFHTRACGGHLSGLEIAQKILHAGYFWPSLIKYCVDVVKSVTCSRYSLEKCAHTLCPCS
jgi:hypothetical protein